MGIRVSKLREGLIEPSTGDYTVREEVFSPEQASHTSGTENYLNEDAVYKAKSSTPDNPY